MIVTNEKCKKVFPNAETTRCGKQEVDLKKLMRILEKKRDQELSWSKGAPR